MIESSPLVRSTPAPRTRVDRGGRVGFPVLGAGGPADHALRSGPTQVTHPNQPILRAVDLEKQFPGGARALAGVSLEVRPGEMLVIVGRSGAGKSTLLRCLNRLHTPTSGRVELDGRDVTRVSGSALRRVRREVGMIFQQFNLVPRLTVLQNVLAGRLRFAGWPAGAPLSWCRVFARAERERAIDALARVGIESLAFQRAGTLSGGQQQRVAIARILAQQPRVILADEPIASLDPHSAAVVMDALQDINRRTGVPVVVNLHQVDVARRYASRIVGMAQGRVVFEGAAIDLTDDAADELYRQPPRAGDVPAAAALPAHAATAPAGPIITYERSPA